MIMAPSGPDNFGDWFIDAHLLMVLYHFTYTFHGIHAWRFDRICL